MKPEQIRKLSNATIHEQIRALYGTEEAETVDESCQRSVDDHYLYGLLQLLAADEISPDVFATEVKALLDTLQMHIREQREEDAREARREVS